MSGVRLLAAAALLAAIAGCSKSEAPNAGATDSGHIVLHVDGGLLGSASAHPGASASAATTTASAAPAEEQEDPPPNERKADRKANREINATNYKAELTKVEKEIGNPP